MAGADTSTEDDDLSESKSEFDRAVDAWSKNYEEGLDDFRFGRLHLHWPEKIKKERELEGRPCLTVPKLPAVIRQVVNDARQNKPEISVSPSDDVADPRTAEVFNGLIRQIEKASHAHIAYDTAIDHTATGGFGYFTLNLEYATDDSFLQDIKIVTNEDAFSIVPDPDDKTATSLNWNTAFQLESMSKRVFEEEFDGADPVSFDGVKSSMESVRDGDMVKIVRRWVREKTKRKIVAVSAINVDLATANPEAAAQAAQIMPESMILDLGVYEQNKDLFDVLGVGIVGQPRAVPTFKVKRLTCSGAEVLETLDWAGKYIPIIAVYGSDVVIEGERTLEGLVRSAKDSQRMFNYWRTTSTELVALAPRAPFIGRVGAFDTDHDKWATANTQNHAYIEYDVPEGAADAGPPQRQPFSGVPAGALQEALNAADDIKSITGIHDASLGAKSNETSGRAIMARQREGDVGTYHYIDNLSRAIATAGEMLLDLIPKVYSTARVVRVLGPDRKKAELVKVNQPTKIQEKGEDGQLQEIEHIYDLTVGKYDLTVAPGPSFTSRREEAATQMIEFIRAYPQSAPFIGDLLAQNLDWPGAEEVAERLKAMLPAQLQGQSAEAQAAQAQIKALAEALGQLRAENQQLKADRSLEERKLNIQAYGEETDRLKVVIPKGAPFDPAAMEAVIAQSLEQVFSSPDILAAAQSGATPQELAAMLAQRMRRPPEDDGSAGAPVQPTPTPQGPPSGTIAA